MEQNSIGRPVVILFQILLAVDWRAHVDSLPCALLSDAACSLRGTIFDFPNALVCLAAHLFGTVASDLPIVYPSLWSNVV